MLDWFGIAATALIVAEKLSYVEAGSTRIGDDHPGIYPSHSAWPSLWSSCIEYWRWFRPLLRRNGEFCVAVDPVADVLAYCMLTYLRLTCTGSPIKVKSNQFNSGNVAHLTNMRDKRQTDTITNMTVEDIKTHKHGKIYGERGQT